MKTLKTICTIVLSFALLTVNAQLKVSATGNVGIQLGTNTPLSPLSVGSTGNSNTKFSVQGNTFGISTYRTGTPGYSWTYALVASSDVHSNSAVGILANTCSSTPTGSGRAWGVWGMAGNSSSGYNYGVWGLHYGECDGAGIVGTVNNNRDVCVPGIYAGYFDGDVESTGVMYAQDFIISSDKRLKKNIASFKNNKKSLDNVLLLNPVEYNLEQQYMVLKGDTAKKAKPLYDENSQSFKKKHFGLIAQELQEIYPELVFEKQNGMLAVDYVGLIPVLIQSIQELQAQVNTLSTGSEKQNAPQSIKRNTSDISLEEVYPATLYQNNPNPFNQSTTIDFSIPSAISTASIYVYDMKGTQLKSYTIAERGKGNLVIKGSEFRAGMYLYALITDDNVIDTKRMILTK